MTLSSQTLLKWADLLMPREYGDWFDAMTAEISHISDARERRNFAWGCFQTALLKAVRSRRGLNIIARSAGAFFIILMSIAGIWNSVRLGTHPEAYIASRLLIGLCLFYIVSAGLLITSLKGLKVYACAGLGMAVTAWLYCFMARPQIEALPTEFLIAITLEMAGFMIGLLFAATYLNWLYTPEPDNA